MRYFALLLFCSTAFAGAPDCYPPSAINYRITLSPPSYTDWIAATNPYWIVTWFCSSTTDPTGFVGTSLVGYRSELLPNWASLSSSPKAALDALWASNVQNDPELLTVAQAQLQATWPGALRTTGTQVFYVIQQSDKFIATQVGTVAVGTMCNRTQTVNGMYGVPVASVTWLGNVKPLVVVAACQ